MAVKTRSLTHRGTKQKATAVRITKTNYVDVATWIGGGARAIEGDTVDQQYVSVPATAGKVKAKAGTWVVKSQNRSGQDTLAVFYDNDDLNNHYE